MIEMAAQMRDAVISAAEEVLDNLGTLDTDSDEWTIPGFVVRRLRAAFGDERSNERSDEPLYSLAVRLGLDYGSSEEKVTEDAIYKHVLWLEERARAEEREDCAKLADIETNACNHHLRAAKAARRKGIQHEAGAQIASAIATFIRRRGRTAECLSCGISSDDQRNRPCPNGGGPQHDWEETS